MVASVIYFASHGAGRRSQSFEVAFSFGSLKNGTEAVQARLASLASLAACRPEFTTTLVVPMTAEQSQAAGLLQLQ